MKIVCPLNLLLASIVASTLTACVVIGPGDKPDSVPPRLVVDKNGPAWDRPHAFGPVPAELQATGNEICKNVGTAKATGYHPKAQDVNGKAITGGGYYCVAKK